MYDFDTFFFRSHCVVFRSLQVRETAWTLSQTDEFVLILQFSLSRYREELWRYQAQSPPFIR